MILEGNFNPAFLNSFESLTKKNNQNSKVVFISLSEGDISSILANGFVEQLGYKNIFSLQGGIKEWIKSWQASAQKIIYEPSIIIIVSIRIILL